MGNDGPRIRRIRLRRLPPEHEGSGVGDLIASPSQNICEGPPRGGPLFLRRDQSVFEFLARRVRLANSPGGRSESAGDLFGYNAATFCVEGLG